MSGWLVFAALAAVVLLVLWRLARLAQPTLMLSAGALAIAGGGYAWQGNPSLPSAPATALDQSAAFDAAGAQAHPMKPAFNRTEMVLNTAQAMIRAHNSAGAVALLQGEMHGFEGNADLWIGLGNALVAHGDGLISPAALFAFDKAAALAPEQPLPPMMHAMALAQAGRMAESAAALEQLLARTPQDAPYRADLVARLGAVKARQ